MKNSPNILLFMVDQLSARWLEGAGQECVDTPNLDRLRSRGIRFSRTYTSNPVCMPARSTLATGLSPRQHGVLQNGYQLSEELPTFMGLLKEAGWRNGAFGKVHLRPHFAGVHPDYRPYGFHETRITEDARAGDWLDWIRSEHPQHERTALATIWCADIPELKTYGPDDEDLSSRIKRIRQDFDWSRPGFPNNSAQHYTLPFPEELSQTEWITRQALDFVRTAEADEPIFAQVSYVQPHSPSCPPPDYMTEVDVDSLPVPAGKEWTDDPLHPHCFDAFARPDMTEKAWRAKRHYYFADIAHLDRQLGRIMTTLEECGRLDNTFIIFLSDHGELLLDHGLTGKGEYHYDACIRVPLIISGPGLAEGQCRQETVQLEDIFPTILDMANVELPQPPVRGPYIQEKPKRYPGRSLVPLCKGTEPQRWRQSAYVESYNNIRSASPRHWARTVVDGEWRYTTYPGNSGEQLFDLGKDPNEQNNLAGRREFSAERQEFRDLLMDHIILQDFPHPTRQLYAHGVH